MLVASPAFREDGRDFLCGCTAAGGIWAGKEHKGTFCNYFVISPNRKGRLQSQTDNGAARLASCFIPPTSVEGIGFFIGSQWYAILDGTLLLQKTSRHERKISR